MSSILLRGRSESEQQIRRAAARQVARSVGGIVLVRDCPRPICALRELQIIVRVDHLIRGSPIANLEVAHGLGGSVDELMAQARAGLEAAAIAGFEQILLILDHERRGARDHVNEFILQRMVVQQGRCRTGGELGEIHTEISQSKMIAKSALGAANVRSVARIRTA